MQHAIILAGGAGTRLWPVSRQKTPKQFQTFIGDRTLIQQTFDRISQIIAPERIWVVTVGQQVAKVREQLPDISTNHIIKEPAGRNTAPAIGLATLAIQAEDPEAVVAVLPSDHYIGKTAAFTETVTTIFNYLDTNPTFVATIGIKPTEPNTGFGYIKMAHEIAKNGHSGSIFKVEKFIEKPDAATAQTFFESWEYLWNGGYYFFQAEQLVHHYESLLPETLEALKSFQQHPDQPQIYEAISPEPIDRAIAEKITDLVVVPADLDWSDLGNWATLQEIRGSETGESDWHISVGSDNCLVLPNGKLIATVGLQNIVIVDTDDALLVCNQESVQDVKAVVELLKKNGRETYL